MYLNKAPVRNHSIDRKFRRRVHMTLHMSKIDQRRQRLSRDESLYGRLYYKTRDYDGDTTLWYFSSTLGTVVSAFIFGGWVAVATSTGSALILPLFLLVASVILSIWLLTMKWSYAAYYTIMGKYYDRKIERIGAKRAKVLPNTFVTALANALDKDEFDTMFLLTCCYPGRLYELYEAYKSKVSAADSIKNDSDTYREARRILVDILREDLKDILEEEHTKKEAERKADKLQAAKERQRRRAEAERNQEVLRDLRSFYDTYKQLGA